MVLEVCWDGLWTLSFGLSQFHGHSSWLVCEVALTSEEFKTANLTYSVAFFHSRGWRRHYKIHSKIFRNIFYLFTLEIIDINQ